MIPLDYLINTNIYLHGHDKDGKLLMVFKSKLHVRGTRDIEDLKKCLVYWSERAFRQSKNDKITVVFDMLESGFRNIDLEYTKLIINILKQYYPNSLNWILVYEMPWIMNGKWTHKVWAFFKSFSNISTLTFPATFQIIKKLLPKKAVEVLKFVNAKNVRQYIDDDNISVAWGGKDSYEYSFVPENHGENGEVVYEYGASLHQQANNNNAEQANLNLLHRKVS